MTFSLAASVWLLEKTHSSLLAALVFGGQWIGSALWPAAAARIGRRIRPASLAALAELIATALVLIALASTAFGAWRVLVAVVLLKGYTDTLGRTANTLVVRDRARDCAAVAHDVGRMEFARLAGSTAAGVAFAALGSGEDLSAVMGICALAHLLAASCLMLDRGEPSTATASALSGDREVRLRTALSMSSGPRAALIQLSVITAFQGLHNAIRTVYPMQHLHQGVGGVGAVSAVATAGVFAGGGLASRRRLLPYFMRQGGPWAIVSTACFAVVAVTLKVPLASYALYFLFLAAFEAAFTGSNARFVALLDDHESALFVGVRSTVLGLSALVGLLLTSAALSLTSVQAAVALVALPLAAFALLNSKIVARKERNSYGTHAGLPRRVGSGR